MVENSPTSALNGNMNRQLVDRKSLPFVGRWERLVSRTNWEKGRIIQQWRETLIAAGAPSVEYSDDAWSQRVQAVSGQHVGRLRRVALRFGGVYPKYKGLYWSHFQAAIDWTDAEMWLEGAVQNRWSVSQMRNQRHEALGGPKDKFPSDAEIIHAHLDEDFEPAVEGSIPSRLAASYGEAQAGPRPEGPDFGKTDETPQETGSRTESPTTKPAAQAAPSTPAVRPFDQLPELPENVAQAFEAFKLAILQHKASNWSDISAENVLASLEALKTLVLTPAGTQLPT
ncbi:MAG TPA: hypothetical protein EYN03_09670 [Planctomycetes bacterium]|nr:hypothetical protein [Planctomycetaceae bacterium]HIN95899.1 hypothetical protein [Planctomycetota bacterium]